MGLKRRLFGEDERLLHHFVMAAGTKGRAANDVFGYRGIATGDVVEYLVETEFRSFGFTMLAAGNEALRFEQRRLIDKYDIGLLRGWLQTNRPHPNKRRFDN